MSHVSDWKATGLHWFIFDRWVGDAGAIHTAALVSFRSGRAVRHCIIV